MKDIFQGEPPDQVNQPEQKASLGKQNSFFSTQLKKFLVSPFNQCAPVV